MTPGLKRMHALVDGHVQGVGFRYFVVEQAQELNLTGWVRNLTDGKVEVTAEGNSSDLDSFISRLNEGPRGSHVLEVVIDWLPAEGTFTLFSIKPTN